MTVDSMWRDVRSDGVGEVCWAGVRSDFSGRRRHESRPQTVVLVLKTEGADEEGDGGGADVDGGVVSVDGGAGGCGVPWAGARSGSTEDS